MKGVYNPFYRRALERQQSRRDVGFVRTDDPVGLWASLGSGRQWVPWIHLQDVVGLYGLAVQDSSLTDVVNQIALGLLTNRQFMEALAQHFHKPLCMLSSPAFMLKLMMEERSAFVLNSARVVLPEPLLHEYRYQYPTLDQALSAIYA